MDCNHEDREPVRLLSLCLGLKHLTAGNTLLVDREEVCTAMNLTEDRYLHLRAHLTETYGLEVTAGVETRFERWTLPALLADSLRPEVPLFRLALEATLMAPPL